jgi:xanthine dehydrogenase YagR molybdenum-binding subunit
VTQTFAPEVEKTVGRAVGLPLDRMDGPGKVTGTVPYAADYNFPDLAYATLVHATITCGRIVSIDTAAAAAVPGVITVLTHENAPRMKPLSGGGPMPGGFGADINYLNTDVVHWNGQAIAVVVAENLAAAEDAAERVRVEYEATDAVTDFVAEQPNAKPARGVPILMPSRQQKGDVWAALAAAPVSVDITVTTPPYQHNAIEPHATIAIWNDNDKLTVYDATQHISRAASNLSKRWGLPVENVTVIAPYVGGGFGGKAGVWASLVLAPVAARAVGRPVRLVLTREGVYRSVGGRPPCVQRIAIGADRDGTITALVHKGTNATSRLGGFPEGMTSPSDHLYAAPNMLLERTVVVLDTLPNAPMRAPGTGVGLAALEIAIDELAEKVGLDPIEFRLRNEAHHTAFGKKKISHRSLPEAYARGAAEFGWHLRNPEPRSMRDGHWLIGMGVATAARDANAMTADVTIRMNADGTVVVSCGFQDSGMGTGIAIAQVVADELSVPVAAVEVIYGASSLPTAPGAFGSMHTSSVVHGVLAACAKLRKKLDALAKRAGTTGESYPLALQRTMTPYVEVAHGAKKLEHRVNSVKALAGFIQDLRKLSRFSSGAHFVEVRVNEDTGEVRLSRWLGVFDVGAALNKKMVESQLRGAIVMGIGMALTEETLIDPRTGRTMNAHLSDYHVPVHADVPQIEIRCLDTPDPSMPLGMYGMGELGVNGSPAAILNAVYHATGRRIYDYPVTPDKVLGLAR